MSKVEEKVEMKIFALERKENVKKENKNNTDERNNKS